MEKPEDKIIDSTEPEVVQEEEKVEEEKVEEEKVEEEKVEEKNSFFGGIFGTEEVEKSKCKETIDELEETCFSEVPTGEDKCKDIMEKLKEHCN